MGLCRCTFSSFRSPFLVLFNPLRCVHMFIVWAVDTECVCFKCFARQVSLPPYTPLGSAVILRQSWTLGDHVRISFKKLSTFRWPILWHRIHLRGRPWGVANLLVQLMFPSLSCAAGVVEQRLHG